MISRAVLPLGVSLTVAGALTAVVGLSVGAAPAAALDAVNPVRIDEAHPANSGFLTFVESDVVLAAGESEGTIATGGDLTFLSPYNVMSKPGGFATPTAPGDAHPTTLFVGGDVRWSQSTGRVLRVLDSGFTKIGGDDFTARSTDDNGAAVSYRVLPEGAAYESTPRIEGTTSQSAASVGAAEGLVDVAGAFPRYRDLSTQMGQCAATLVPRDAAGKALPSPVPAGSQVYLDLQEGVTNVLRLSTEELAGITSLTVRGAAPADGTTLLVDVAGASYDGPMPNQAGVGSAEAPWILWNFPDATSLRFTGGDSVEGTLYAPRADLRWHAPQNIEGNVIAHRFEHGGGTSVGGGEIHDFPFRGTIGCAGETPPTEPTEPTEPTTAPTEPTEPTTAPTEPTTAPTEPTGPTTAPTEPTASVAPTTSTPSTAGVGGAEQHGSDGSLPGTGGPASWLIALGAVLVAGGAAVVGLARRRRTTD